MNTEQSRFWWENVYDRPEGDLHMDVQTLVLLKGDDDRVWEATRSAVVQSAVSIHLSEPLVRVVLDSQTALPRANGYRFHGLAYGTDFHPAAFVVMREHLEFGRIAVRVGLCTRERAIDAYQRMVHAPLLGLLAHLRKKGDKNGSIETGSGLYRG